MVQRTDVAVPKPTLARIRRIELRVDSAIVAHVASRRGSTFPGEDLGVHLIDHFDHPSGCLFMGYILGEVVCIVTEAAVNAERPAEVSHNWAQIFGIVNLEDLQIGGRLAKGIGSSAGSLAEHP